MRKLILITFSFLLITGISISAQVLVKAKDSAATTVITTTKVEPFKMEMKVPKDSTKTTVITTTKVEPVKIEMKAPKDSTKTTIITTTKVEPVKTEIKSYDLPQPVKDLGADFKSQGWDTEEKAYVVKGVNGDVAFYVVTFKNTKGGETKSINIDAKGNIVKE